jgi:xanthine dehydrogenase accessory factor
VKGAGDLATGAALSFRAVGFRVVMTELPLPAAIRLSVSFAEAVYRGSHVVEGIRAELADGGSWRSVVESGHVAVIVDPRAAVLQHAGADVILDAIMAKANTGTTRAEDAVVIALGPGFAAGRDVDAVIETMRGHELGRIIRDGSARPDTGTPGDIGGRSADRVLWAPRDGRVALLKRIGDTVVRDEVLMRVEDIPVIAPFDGCLRGLINEKVMVSRGMKIGDVDPRGDASFVHLVSDKAHAVGRAALEAALWIGRERGLFEVSTVRNARGVRGARGELR